MKYTIEAATELTLRYIEFLIESCQVKVTCGCDSGIMCEHSVCKDKTLDSWHETQICILHFALTVVSCPFFCQQMW